MSDLMTVGEAAKRLGVAADTVRLWVRNGRLAACRTDTGVRIFKREDVEALALRRLADLGRTETER